MSFSYLLNLPFQIKQVKNPEPGRWMIKSSSTTPHAIEIKTASEMDFLYGFSLTLVGSLDKTIPNPVQSTFNYEYIVFLSYNSKIFPINIDNIFFYF